MSREICTYMHETAYVGAYLWTVISNHGNDIILWSPLINAFPPVWINHISSPKVCCLWYRIHIPEDPVYHKPQILDDVAKLPLASWPSPCMYTYNKSHYKFRMLNGHSVGPLSWLLPRTSGLSLASVSGAVGVIRCVRTLAKYDHTDTIFHMYLTEMCFAQGWYLLMLVIVR